MQTKKDDDDSSCAITIIEFHRGGKLAEDILVIVVGMECVSECSTGIFMHSTTTVIRNEESEQQQQCLICSDVYAKNRVLDFHFELRYWSVKVIKCKHRKSPQECGERVVGCSFHVQMSLSVCR